LDAKAAVLRLVDDLGFDPVDGGDLDNSWRQQSGTPAYGRGWNCTTTVAFNKLVGFWWLPFGRGFNLRL
jgi:predicted dinucleotide-binding enzyme